jgi:hypothetical protein
MQTMKTTLTIDTQILAELEERAHRQNVPLAHVVNQVLRRGLEAEGPTAPRKPFRARTFSMGRPLIPSLDKSLAIAAALEDEEVARKLALRK